MTEGDGGCRLNQAQPLPNALGQQIVTEHSLRDQRERVQQHRIQYRGLLQQLWGGLWQQDQETNRRQVKVRRSYIGRVSQQKKFKPTSVNSFSQTPFFAFLFDILNQKFSKYLTNCHHIVLNICLNHYQREVMWMDRSLAMSFFQTALQDRQNMKQVMIYCAFMVHINQISTTPVMLTVPCQSANSAFFF